MASQFNNMPVYNTPLMERGRTTKDWFFFFTGLWEKLAPEGEVDVTVGASPNLYTAPRGGFVIVQGGTVSAIEFSRDGVTFYDVGFTQGIVPLSSKDQLRVTYSVLPTMTFVPQ